MSSAPGLHQIEQQIRWWGRDAELSNHAADLAAVQGRVIDDMLHLLNER